MAVGAGGYVGQLCVEGHRLDVAAGSIGGYSQAATGQPMPCGESCAVLASPGRTIARRESGTELRR